MSSQLPLFCQYSLKPGEEETAVTVCSLDAINREQYNTLFADVLIPYKLLKIEESIGEGIHTTTHSQQFKMDNRQSIS